MSEEVKSAYDDEGRFNVVKVYVSNSTEWTPKVNTLSTRFVYMLMFTDEHFMDFKKAISSLNLHNEPDVRRSPYSTTVIFLYEKSCSKSEWRETEDQRTITDLHLTLKLKCY